MKVDKPVEIGLPAKTFDNYALDCYRNCPAYYDFRINQKVVKAGDVKIAADFGSCIHSALEHWYKDGMTDQAIAEALEIFVKGYEPTSVNVMDEKRSLGKGLEILSNYFLRYKHEPFNVIATEVGGACEVGEYLYTVRLDIATEYLSPKGIYGMDHKTSSALPRLIVKPNNQITGYIYYLTQVYENILGYMINGIGVYATDEEIDKSVPKVLSPKTGKLVYAKKQREMFIRMPTSRSSVELEGWKKEVIHTIHLIEVSTEKGVWVKHAPQYCTAYRGKCQYLDLCLAQAPYEILQSLLSVDIYETKPWTPYVGVGEDKEDEDATV
jgi:hypothetical protein